MYLTPNPLSHERRGPSASPDPRVGAERGSGRGAAVDGPQAGVVGREEGAVTDEVAV
jgi:hypothetical protein